MNKKNKRHPDICLADSESFLRLRQAIYERLKECYEERSNSRELAYQLRDLTTKPTFLSVMMVIKNRPSKMKFFWFQVIFFVNFDFKNGCKN